MNPNQNWNANNMQRFLTKWQTILRLNDWDISLQTVEKQWRKTGDIKIDMCDKTAILLINTFNPKQENLEMLIIHELLHLKLYGMDQMIENYITALHGSQETPAKEIAYSDFMVLLESTVHDLSKAFLSQSGEDKNIPLGRLQLEVDEETGNSPPSLS